MKVGRTRPAGARPAHGRPRQTVVAAAVGALAAAGGAVFWQGVEARQRACQPDASGGSCEGLWPLVQLIVGVPLVVLAVGVLLRLLAVPRPELVAAGGAVAVFAAFQIYGAGVAGTPPPPTWLAGLVGAVCFAVLALACAPGGRRQWWVRGAAVLVLLAVLAVALILPG